MRVMLPCRLCSEQAFHLKPLCLQPPTVLCPVLMGLAVLMVKPVCWTVRSAMASWTAPTTVMKMAAPVGPL